MPVKKSGKGQAKTSGAKVKRSHSSRQWLDRQHRDIYTQKAKKAGFRSRAVYKLTEIQEKDRLCRTGMTVVDLGAAPGGWSQVLAQWVGAKGQVIALDILPIEPLPGVDIIEGDFRESGVIEALESRVGRGAVDVVLSDIAPNFSGVEAVDQARTVYLGELALDFAQHVLKPGGSFLVKFFQGEGFEPYMARLKTLFQFVAVRKPKASRAESREVYLLAKQYGHSPQMRG
jgi:23S rRNA (uridine2552-2'-O)-methyltransferase